MGNQLSVSYVPAGVSASYVELRVALCSCLEGILAGLSLALSGGAGPSSESGRRADDTRGGAEGRAGDDGGHGGVQLAWVVCEKWVACVAGAVVRC